MNAISEITEFGTTLASERKVVTAIPGPKSIELHDRRRAVVAGGVGALYPVYMERGIGAIIVDVDGNQYIDLSSGIGVTTLGHADAASTEAVHDQSTKLTHTLFTVVGYEPYVRVAELLSELVPGDGYKSALFNSGSEAVENAVKVARKFTGKPAIAVLRNGYHGRTNLTMAMNHKHSPYSTGMGPLASSIYHAPNSYPFHDGLTGLEAAARTIEYLEVEVGVDQLAGLVLEPVQGEGGFIIPAEGYLPALQEWCRSKGVVFIADEVQSGLGRTGYAFASIFLGIEPDLIVTAKSLANGYPLAGVTGRAEMMDAVLPGGLGGTYTGNPVAAAAAVTVLERLRDADTLLASASRIEAAFRRNFEPAVAANPYLGEFRGTGAMVAVEFIDPATKAPNAELLTFVSKYALEHGVLIVSAGAGNNVLRFLPPLGISDELIDDACAVMLEAIDVWTTEHPVR